VRKGLARPATPRIMPQARIPGPKPDLAQAFLCPHLSPHRSARARARSCSKTVTYYHLTANANVSSLKRNFLLWTFAEAIASACTQEKLFLPDGRSAR
jgi:hypothetical protein